MKNTNYYYYINLYLKDRPGRMVLCFSINYISINRSNWYKYTKIIKIDLAILYNNNLII
jgi:hypothetical protein